MKTTRFLLAAAIAMAAAACSGNVVGPEPEVRAPASTPHQSESLNTTDATTTEAADDDSGAMGSGCCAVAKG